MLSDRTNTLFHNDRIYTFPENMGLPKELSKKKCRAKIKSFRSTKNLQEDLTYIFHYFPCDQSYYIHRVDLRENHDAASPVRVKVSDSGRRMLNMDTLILVYGDDGKVYIAYQTRNGNKLLMYEFKKEKLSEHPCYEAQLNQYYDILMSSYI